MTVVVDGGLRANLTTWTGRLMKPLFEVSADDIPPMTHADAASVARLEQVVGTVTECIHLTLLNSRVDLLVPRLDAYDEELRGFAYEGAGGGLAALDTWLPWKRRTKAFATGEGARYVYAIYLGAGMSLARMHRHPERFRARLEDPVFSWVVLDGYGFHQGFFAHDRYVIRREVPRRMSGYARRGFDQGLGRSIWFASGADPDGAVRTISGFPPARQPDLWSGVGLACGYTGGADRSAVETLPGRAHVYRPQLALGAVIAAKARQQVGNPAPHNEMACEVLCGMNSVEAAAVADAALRDLPPDGDPPPYEIWRQRIVHALK
jgi:hypothetical protein